MTENEKTPIKKKNGKIYKSIRHLIAISLWGYIITSLLIFNVDNFIVSKYIFFAKYIQYKFIFIIFAIACSWLLLGTKTFIIGLFYIALYPALLILKVIFKMLGFSPNSFLAVVGYSLWAIKSAKRWFIISTFYLTFCLIILFDFNNYLTTIGMVCLLLLLVYHYIDRIYKAFRPETVISNINKFINTTWNESRKTVFTKEIQDNEKYPVGSDEYKTKRFKQILIIFLINTMYNFFLRKLRSFHESRILAVSSMLKLLITFCITVIAFGFIYKGLSQLYINSFLEGVNTGIFNYIYASFNIILTVGMPDFNATSSLAKLLVASEQVCSISLMIILFFIFTTIVRERQEKDLKQLITNINEENLFLIELLPIHFNITIDQIMKLEGFEQEEHKKQIEGLLKFKKNVLKIEE